MAEPICFILLVDKEVQGSASDSLLNQRHAPSSKRILKGSLLQGNEVLPGGGQSYGDVVKGSKRADAKRFVVKPLSGDMQFQCRSWEIGRITVPERDLLRAISTNSDRFNIYQDEDLIPYALGLKEGSSVIVRHRNDSTSPYEEVAALVRYIGPLSETEMGTYFGLELMDNAYRGQGTSDGVFGKCRYFQTDPDCAVFVPISKLVPPSTSQGTTHLYENVPRSKQELPNQPSELPSVGDIIKGTTVYLQVGNGTRRGRVVYMIVPHKETEPYAVVEMPKQEGDMMWNGIHRGYRVFTPRNDVFTTFVPVNNLTTRAPEEYQDLYTGAIPKEPSQTPPSKAKNKGKKSSEPFWAANAKPRKTPSPYGSSEKLDKRSHKPSGGSRDVSDNYNPASQARKTDMHQDSSDDLQFASGHEGSKSKRKSFSGFVNKMKSKWSSGGKDEETTKTSWYTENYNGPGDVARGSYLDTNFLEEDVVEEVAKTIYKDWRTVGFSLYLSREEIDRIAADCETEKDRTAEMLRAWQRKTTGYNNISRLAEACRSCHFDELANKLEQGLDETLLCKIACGIPPEKARPFGTFLNFSDEELDYFDAKAPHTLARVRFMLAKWRTRQSHNSDKIMLLSNTLQSCGLRQLALEVARGLDDDIMLSFAVQIGQGWKNLAKTLRLDVKDIQQLEDFSEDKQPYQMLMLWRRRQHRSVDVLGALAKGLRESGLLDLAYGLVQGVTDEMLYKLAMMIGDKWEVIALHLGFTEEELAELKSDKFSETTTTILNMLTKWRERHDYTRDRFGFLMEALRACDLGNLAESMEEDRRRVEQSKKVAPCAKTEEYPGYAKDKAADDKEEVNPMKQLPSEYTSFTFPTLPDEPQDEPQDEPCYPDLEVNSMVEVKPSDKTLFGVIRWIGVPAVSKSNKPVAGIELESSIDYGATDGTFNKQRYFQCEPNKAIFVYLSKCRPDSHVLSQAQTFSSTKCQTSQDFGGFASPLVEGFVDPPLHLRPEFVGMQKGIQGDQNSCYLDSTLFSMFAYNGVFDPLLQRMQGQGDLQEYEKVQKTLRESIVNPLRKNGFVRADRILQLREHLDQLGTTKGLMSEEKDPEEFLHTLLSEVFKSRPLLKIRHGANEEVDESNIHQIFLEKDESLTLPTVEQLLLQSFQEHDLKLVEAPSCLIVQMPRFGKDYKMYNRILPSLQLDVTNIIEEYPRQCLVCGNLAVFECSECKTEEALEDTTLIKNFCENCFLMMHGGTHREHHKPSFLTVPDHFLKEFFSKTMEKGFSELVVDQHRQRLLPTKLMDLFAVICIRTSHYVAFVKAGREKDSEWVFFDSMADRQGDQQGYYIPQITLLKDFRKWVDVDHIKARIEAKQLTEIMERLLGDAYICMYSDSEQCHQTYV
ncbi:ubiquitin carboxyl-terminal hydrolase CYLD-like isoform X2 [Patiria miniata]|uniref:ubiquitinyl hydrolase 1 n=1 Tax=Patiria miniata TaxID=46514 RepID=A0A914AU42_PATMI|nr:ubiquitin carboxyl-terminal hydrolase CYLD-like isoform X2 [Patiria miniata]